MAGRVHPRRTGRASRVARRPEHTPHGRAPLPFRSPGCTDGAALRPRLEGKTDSEQDHGAGLSIFFALYRLKSSLRE